MDRRRVQEELSLLKLRAGRDPRWRALAPHMGDRGRVLDVGCGLGTWAMFLARRGFKVVGVDYSLPLLVGAAARRPLSSVRWAAGMAQQLPFRDEEFDYIISWGVIEHDSAGPLEALTEFRRVLAKGGRVVVTVPLDGPTQRRAEEIVNAGRSREEFYEYHFNPGELQAELEQAGFKVELTAPCTRSMHVAYPRIYRRLARSGAVTRDLVTQLFKPLTAMRTDAFHMLMGVGTKR